MAAVFSAITVVIFFTFSRYFNEIAMFYIGIPFALSVFFGSLTFLPHSIHQWQFANASSQRAKAFFYLLTASSVIIVLLISPFNGSMLEWMNIPLLNWMRYFASLLLTSFLPGFFLLKLLDKKSAIKGSSIAVLSYLLSIFITFLVAFFILLTSDNLSLLGLPMIVSVNITLVIISYLTRDKQKHVFSLTVNWIQSGLILSILGVITLGSVVVMVNNLPITPGDMRDHYGITLNLSKGFPIYGGEMIAYSGGYLFHLYLSVLFTLSGIPSALAEQGLYILSFMPLLAFYSTLRAWFNAASEKKLVLTGTFLSLLLGFGGLYALYLGLVHSSFSLSQLLSTATANTYDIGMRILYLPDAVAPIWSIGLPILFTLLLFLKEESSKLIKATIIPILVSLGYLAHISEIFIFTLLLFIYALFIRRGNAAKVGPSVILGLFIVALLDLIAPVHVYVLSDADRSVSVPFIATFVIAGLASVAEIAKDRHQLTFFVNLKKSLPEKLEKAWPYLRWISLYTYLLFLVVWLAIEPNFNLWQWGGYNFTPFFVFPIRFGAVGLLAVISIFLYFSKIIHNRALLFFALFIPIGFVLEQIGNYYPIYPAYRYGTIAFVGACVIAAYGLITTIGNMRNHISGSAPRKAVMCLCLGFLIISGMLSTTLFYVNASYYTSSKISQEALADLDYIRLHTPANASVLTFTPDSAGELRALAGLNAAQDAQRWSQLLLSTSNPYVIIDILSSSNIRYIYVAQRDNVLLNASYLNHFTSYFPIAVKNSYATVYEVPLITAPSSQAPFGVLYFPLSVSSSRNITWIDDSFTEGWHQYRQYGEVKDSNLSLTNGTMQISVTSNETGNVWASWVRSDLFLNTTVYSGLSFRYYVESNLTWFTIRLWNSTNQTFFYTGRLSATHLTKEELTLPQNQTVTGIEVVVETTDKAPAETAAYAHIDFIQLSAPVTSFEDESFTKDWEFYRDYGDISEESAHYDKNNFQITIISNQIGNTWLSYSHTLNLQTKNSVLSFRYKVDNDYTWFTIILQNATNRFFFYRGHLTDTTFTTKSYHLPEGQTITRVELIVETRDGAPPKASAAAEIDNIKISPEPYSKNDALPSLFASLLHTNYVTLYVDDVLLKGINTRIDRYTHILLPSDPVISVESLLEWVSAGNTLSVVNANGNGFFANLLGVNSSSPLLTMTKIGLGRIIYVNSFPLIVLGRESEILQPEFLRDFRGILSLTETSARTDTLPVYNSTSGCMEVKGNLQVKTDTLTLSSLTNFENLPFPLNKSSEITLYGKISLTIENSAMLIAPSESYVRIKPENYPIEVEIVIDNTDKAQIVTDVISDYLLNAPASFRFETTSLLVYARLPSVNASGSITFDQLDVHSALYIPLAGIVQQPAEIHGNVEFDVSYATSPITIFSTFQSTGTVLNLGQETAYKPTISWIEVLRSPYNIALNVVFFLSIAIYVARKRGTIAIQHY